MKKIRWGVLGVAKIATTKVIPAMQRASNAEIAAIASRDLEKAKVAAEQLNIPQAYGSYEELLTDPSIDAIYNPLPNHLHVPWSIRAAEAGKHVLCEKPIGLSVAETRDLIAARDKAHVKIGEAFMARTHPQWLRAAQDRNALRASWSFCGWLAEEKIILRRGSSARARGQRSRRSAGGWRRR